MILKIILSLLISLSTGLVCISIFCAGLKPGVSQRIFKVCLGSGLGFGISSCFFFLWLLAFGSPNKAFFIIEIAFLVGLTLILLYVNRVRKNAQGPLIHTEAILTWKIHKFLLIGFVILLVSSMLAGVLFTLVHPHGNWDAWAIWNMRARFLFRGGDQWRDAFSQLVSWSHTDYPLLIPGSVARGWSYIGHESVVFPAVLSVIFMLAIVGITYSSLTILRSRTQGLLAGFILLGTPSFVKSGTFQYADLPLGFFFLATLVLFYLRDRWSTMNGSLLILAGMTTGLAAWTKNEGILFLVSIIVARFVVILPLRGWKDYLKEMRSFLIGLIPLLAILIYFKIKFATPNDLLAPQELRYTLEKLADSSRYFIIFKIFVKEAFYSFGHWILLIFYFLLLGIESKVKDKSSIITSLIVLSLMFAGYFFVYVITPNHLFAHLITSSNRLLMQLWPSFVFIYFMIVNTPEQRVMQKKNKPA